RSAFRVIRTVREKHACTQCDAIVQAPAPSRPIERGIAGPGLLSPLEEALQDYVLTDGKLHADDTPVPVLLPGNKKTKTGRLWT
ncbi:IS66 family transposase, partial [Escherichia coli]